MAHQYARWGNEPTSTTFTMVLIICIHPSTLESLALPLGSTIRISPLWFNFESLFQAPFSLFTAQACSLEFEILLIISALLFKPSSHSPQPSQLDRAPYIYACQRDAKDNMDVQLGQSWLHFLSIEYKAGCGGRGLRVKGMGCNSQPGKGPYSMHTFPTLIYEFNLRSGGGGTKRTPAMQVQAEREWKHLWSLTTLVPACTFHKAYWIQITGTLEHAWGGRACTCMQSKLCSIHLSCASPRIISSGVWHFFVPLPPPQVSTQIFHLNPSRLPVL